MEKIEPENPMRRGLLFGASLAPMTLAGCKVEDILGKITSYKSRMVEAKLAQDEQVAKGMLDAYRNLIDTGTEEDFLPRWYTLTRKYAHDPKKIFRFLNEEGFFKIIDDTGRYRVLYSRYGVDRK